MLIDLTQIILHTPIDPSHLATLVPSDLFQALPLTPHDGTILAQIKETDLSGDVSKMWQHFVKTGQVWAFIVGAVVGYFAKTFTSYG